MDYLFNIETLSTIGTVAGGFMLGSKCGECQQCCKCDGCFNGANTILFTIEGVSGYYSYTQKKHSELINRTYRLTKVDPFNYQTYKLGGGMIGTGIGNYNCYYVGCIDYPYINIYGLAGNSNLPSYSLPYIVLIFNKQEMTIDNQLFSAACSSGTMYGPNYFFNTANTGSSLTSTDIGLITMTPSIGGFSSVTQFCSLPIYSSGSGVGIDGQVKLSALNDSSGFINTIYPPSQNSSPLQGCQCTISNTGASGVFTTLDPSCTVYEDMCVECWLESGIDPYWILNSNLKSGLDGGVGQQGPNYGSGSYSNSGYITIETCDVAPIIVSVSLSGVPHFSDLNNSYELEWWRGLWRGAFVISDSDTNNTISKRLISISVNPMIGKVDSSGNDIICDINNVNYNIRVNASTESFCGSFNYNDYTDCRQRTCGSISGFTVQKTIPYTLCAGENSWYYYIGSGTPPTGLNIKVSY